MKEATKTAALKLALEALENHCGNYKLDNEGVKRFVAACKAIEEALAPTSTQCEVQDEQSSSQEPVGFVDSKLNPIKRPWVGLTEEENLICLGFNKVLGLQYQEAKLKAVNGFLKEKNT